MSKTISVVIDEEIFNALLTTNGMADTFKDRYLGRNSYDELVCAIKLVRNRILVPACNAGLRMKIGEL